MKTFETLEELWSYCSFCPICRGHCRRISISVGPDNIFKFVTYKKEENILKLYCTYRQRKQDKYKANYIIDTISGKFGVEVVDMIDVPDSEMNADTNLDEEEQYRLRVKVSKTYFYFYINGECETCNSATVNSTDVELSHDKHIVTNMGLEREGIYIILPKDKYHLSIMYDSNKTQISKCIIDKLSYDIFDDGKIFECPIVNFDFSNLQKVVNKIKTLITFS